MPPLFRLTVSRGTMTEHSPHPSSRPALVFAAGLLVAWLLPNHYSPWTAFHADWVAAAALWVCAVVSIAQSGRSAPLSMPAIVVLAVASIPVAQAVAGLIEFRGDAWLAGLYLVGFAAAIHCGVENAKVAGHRSAIEPLAWAFVIGAVTSAAIAVMQWLGFDSLGLLAAGLKPGGRPYGNLAQPNQLATLLVTGLVFALQLHGWRRIGGPALLMMAAMLLFGVVLTQSRSGWIELAVLAGWLLATRKRIAWRFHPAWVLVAGVVFVGMQLSLPRLTELLLLTPSARSIAEQTGAGVRPIHWMTVIDAIGRAPWGGYGWNQVAVGIAQVAAQHVPSTEMVEHSHNLVLDLFAWNGLPIGLAIVVGVILWVAGQVRRARDVDSALLLAAIVMPLVHSMFEFPLEYAYFLLPVGYFVGCLEAGRSADRPGLRVPRWAQMTVALAVGLMVVWVGKEYLEIEENHRELMYETARIGPDDAHPPAPDVILLTQLQAFLQFARIPARPGMSAEELEWMRKVGDRYGYPPVLFRYALASGLNHDAAEARRALLRICKQHPRPLCDEARNNWTGLQAGKYPVLRTIAFPSDQEVLEGSWLAR